MVFFSRNFIPVHAKICSMILFLQLEFCTICRCTILSTNLTSDFCCHKRKRKIESLKQFSISISSFTKVSVCRCLRMKHFFIGAGGFPLLLGDGRTNDHMNVQKRFPFLRTHPDVTIYRYMYVLDCYS